MIARELPKDVRNGIRKAISEILIQWGMGTKQVAIIAIMNLVIEYIKKTEKAYGGCGICYGKGYSTFRHGNSSSNDLPDHEPIVRTELGVKTYMNFCICDRGKQLRGFIEHKKL